MKSPSFVFEYQSEKIHKAVALVVEWGKLDIILKSYVILHLFINISTEIQWRQNTLIFRLIN